MKNIQIPQSLFYDLIRYFVFNNEDPDVYKRICDEINKKVDKIVAHNLFTAYKTATSPVERENARKEYLDHIGILDAFRSPTEVKNEDL